MFRVQKVAWAGLALLFLGLSWLWEALAPIVDRLVGLLPLRRLKIWVNLQFEKLSAYMTLLLFLIPLALSEGFKVFSLLAIGHRQIVFGIIIYLFAELVRFGLAAFVWKACRTKLLTIAWVARLHGWLLVVHDWAQSQIAPIKTWVRSAMIEANLIGGRPGLFLRARALWRYSRRKTI